MNVRAAKHIGFCFGVKRAVTIAENALKERQGIFCLGPLIHNPQEVRRLCKKGLVVISDIRRIKKGATLLIRSHGLLPGLIDAAGRRGVRLIDATCPFVKKAQKLCRALSEDGFDTLVIGEKSHPEVKSIVGFSNGTAQVVEGLSDIKRLNVKRKKIGIIAQTTQSRANFQEAAGAVLKRFKGSHPGRVRVFDTICGDSSARQASAEGLSALCDAMFVVGGKNSANSRRLAEICAKNSRTYHIENAGGIKRGWLAGKNNVGVVSGASTPDWVIAGVIKKLKNIKIKK